MGSKKVKGGILLQILLISILPIVIGLTIVAVIAINSLTNGMQMEVLTGLSDVTDSVAEAYNSMLIGDYRLEGDQLYKGECNLSMYPDALDNFVDDSDVELTVFYGDTRYVTTITNENGRLIGTQAADEVIEAVINKGEVYQSTSVMVEGEPFFASYRPIYNGNEVVGMLFAGKPQAEMNEYISSQVGTIITPSIIISIAAVVLCVIFGGMISNGIRNAEKIVDILANGDLTQSPSAKMLAKKDEVGSIARAIEKLRTQLKNMMSEIAQSSNTLAQSGSVLDRMAAQTEGTASEIVNAVEGISRGAVTQASEIETATMQISEMGEKIENITESVERLDATSVGMEDAGNQSEKIIKELTISNDKTIDAIQRIGEQVEATNEAAEKIKVAINAITEIAEQTNLLSLNASIEAARAGEQGKGFAVVATEISKLADESAQSAELISNIVDSLNRESEKSIEVMNTVKEIVSVQVEKLNETTERFAKVTDGINVSRKETEDIKGKAAACDSSKQAIVDVMSDLSAISQENAASTEETNASMEELNATISLLASEAGKIGQLASELDEKIAIFKIN